MIFNFKNIPLPQFGLPIKIIEIAKKLNVTDPVIEPPKDLQKSAITEFRGWIYEDAEKPSKGNIRRLSWSLNFGEKPVIDDPDEMNRVLTLFQPGNVSKKIILGLIHSYFYCYSDNNSSLEILQTRIRLILKNYDKENSLLMHWKDNASIIFVRNGIGNVAKAAVKFEDIQEAIENFKIPNDSHYYRQCLIRITEILVENGDFYEHIEEIIYLLNDYGDISTIQQCVDYLLQGLIKLGKRDIHHELCSFCIRHLRDPRISRSVRWQDVSSDCKKLVIQWVSTSDITLFFDSVVMDVRRKHFWLKYVDSIEYSRLVFGQSTLQSADPVIRKFIAEGRHAAIDGAPSSDCAFIIKLGNAVVVEFSHTGNACYVYYANNIPFSMDELRYAKSKIRDQGYAIDRLYHSGQWEHAFRSYFFSKFGIRP